ncbi:hypothetical protein FKN04_12670 [Bacillus glycinifermentans]|uniref:hypothetical protein n=1 Tax=Bacillus glycinifermentans TaxID=1664069 RepID=UPI001582816F|nr:hypothetical protein [Bacillus glycinifermentans]NUJ17429.1 hypothetical protein [Bacillus glycinifermentans]
MEYNIKLIEELDTNTNIEWWNDNRKRINQVIKLFNDWQIEHRQDSYFGHLVLAKVNTLREWNKDEGDSGFNDWQLEILDEIEQHVKEVLDI